jgi:Lipocalin-like domain
MDVVSCPWSHGQSGKMTGSCRPGKGREHPGHTQERLRERANDWPHARDLRDAKKITGRKENNLEMNIIGTWRLVRAEAFDADGKPRPAPYGNAPLGRVMLTGKGRMMAMTGDGRAHVPDGPVREYNTYAGNYTFDGKLLVTRVDCCSNPAYMGTDQVRDVSHEDGLMVLRPPVRAYANRPSEQRVLYWERISEVDG